MNRYIINILLLLLLSGISSCTKNELLLSGTFSDAPSQPLRILYRAASGNGAFIVDNPVPLTQGAFSTKAVTRYPTVIWVLSPEGTVLMPIYAEKGDELILTGKYADPYSWQVEGNEVMKQYSVWVKTNLATLKSGVSESINAAITKAVKSNPDSRFAAFLLFTRFIRVGFEKEFSEAKKYLTLDTEDMKEIEDASLLPPVSNVAASSAGFQKLALPALADTIEVIKPSDASKTVMYFWRDGFGKKHSDMQKLIKDFAKDSTVQVANIYMDTDTASWHRLISKDTVLRKSHPLWALGGESNPEVMALGIPSVPYIIVTDSKGKQLYRGAAPEKARLLIHKR